MNITKDNEAIVEYIKGYITSEYGRKGSEKIVETKTINTEDMQGVLFIGKTVDAPIGEYKIQMFIPFYESNNYEYMRQMAEEFLITHEQVRIKE